MRKLTIAASLMLAACGPLGADEVLCPCTAIDGDTFKDSLGARYRLIVIDAPEMPGHCRPGRHCVSGDPYLAKNGLQVMLLTGDVRCRNQGKDVYRRWLVECWSRGNYNIGETLLDAGVVSLYERGK